MNKLINQFQNNPEPHEARFESRDVEKDLKFRYKSNGKMTPDFDKMLPKPNASNDSKLLKKNSNKNK